MVEDGRLPTGPREAVVDVNTAKALLRALGLTRRQLGATLAAESVLLSLVATVLGTVVGVAFGWVGVRVLVAAGLLACLVPARRAARVTPAAGRTLD